MELCVCVVYLHGGWVCIRLHDGLYVCRVFLQPCPRQISRSTLWRDWTIGNNSPYYIADFGLWPLNGCANSLFVLKLNFFSEITKCDWQVWKRKWQYNDHFSGQWPCQLLAHRGLQREGTWGIYLVLTKTLFIHSNCSSTMLLLATQKRRSPLWLPGRLNR